MNKAYSSALQFTKIESARERSISTGSFLLDRAYRIPLRAFSLIRGEPMSGTTAIALELAAECTRLGMTVVYADIGDSLFKHRLHGIDKNLLHLIKPTHPLEVIDLVKRIKPSEVEVVYILDSMRFIKEDGWNMSTDLAKLALRLRKIDHKATIICTQRNGPVDTLWSSVLQLSLVEKDYHEDELKGHLIRATGPEGQTELYIEYHTGRMSQAYEEAVLQYENGTPMNGIFKSNDVEIRGFWSYVRRLNDQLRVEFGNDND